MEEVEMLVSRLCDQLLKHSQGFKRGALGLEQSSWKFVLSILSLIPTINNTYYRENW